MSHLRSNVDRSCLPIFCPRRLRVKKTWIIDDFETDHRMVSFLLYKCATKHHRISIGGGVMKKAVLVALVLAVVMIAVMPAVSDARGRYHHRPHYRGSCCTGAAWGLVGVTSGLVAGTIIGSTLTRPAPVYVVSPPPPPPHPRVYYYYPPPPRVYVYPY
jgi:hypothetical protein